MFLSKFKHIENYFNNAIKVYKFYLLKKKSNFKLIHIPPGDFPLTTFWESLS